MIKNDSVKLLNVPISLFEFAFVYPNSLFASFVNHNDGIATNIARVLMIVHLRASISADNSMTGV